MEIVIAKKQTPFEKLKIFNETTSCVPLETSVDEYIPGAVRIADLAKPDALQAVKLDPAVLEAQVTMMAKKRETPQPAIQQVLEEPIKEKARSQSPATSSSSIYERMMDMQREALQSISPHQLQLLIRYVDTLRRQRNALQRTLECAFCKNNGESHVWYSSHSLKDWRGRVLCPVLRAFHCPRCGATGDRAHTIKYCPENNELDRWSPMTF